MSVLKIIYVAEPPQWVRTGTHYPGTYEVGDRLHGRSSPQTYTNFIDKDSLSDVWVCTVAGTGPTFAIPMTSTTMSTYGSGTGVAVFTRQTPAGWSTALPILPCVFKTTTDTGKLIFALVDADWIGPTYNYDYYTTDQSELDYVCVDRVTLLPKVGRWHQNETLGRKYYADVKNKNTYRTGSRLVNRNLVLSSTPIAREANLSVPASRIPGGGSKFTGTAARVKVEGITNALTYASDGVGMVVEVPDVPNGTSLTYNSMGIAFTEYPLVTPAPTADKAWSLTTPL